MVKGLSASIILAALFILRVHSQPMRQRAKVLEDNSFTEESQEQSLMITTPHGSSDNSQPTSSEPVSAEPTSSDSGISNALLARRIKEPKKSSNAPIVRNIAQMVQDRERSGEKISFSKLCIFKLCYETLREGDMYGYVPVNLWINQRPMLVEYLVRWFNRNETIGFLPVTARWGNNAKSLLEKDRSKLFTSTFFLTCFCHYTHVIYPPGKNELIMIDYLMKGRCLPNRCNQNDETARLWDGIKGRRAPTVRKKIIRIPFEASAGLISEEMYIVITRKENKNEIFSLHLWPSVTCEEDTPRHFGSRQISTEHATSHLIGNKWLSVVFSILVECDEQIPTACSS